MSIWLLYTGEHSSTVSHIFHIILIVLVVLYYKYSKQKVGQQWEPIYSLQLFYSEHSGFYTQVSLSGKVTSPQKGANQK